jgi:hypothetical protein
MRIRGEMTDQDKALLGEMLRWCGDQRTADEFLRDIAEASIEELRAWHTDARRMRWTFGLVLEAIDTRGEP